MLPMPSEKEKRIEKLKKQVEQYERKGYTDTAAHQVLASLLGESKPVEGVNPRNAKKAKVEDVKESNDGE